MAKKDFLEQKYCEINKLKSRKEYRYFRKENRWIK